jgi:hypothetical protein
MLVAIVGMYPPTRSGIATFTADVERALADALASGEPWDDRTIAARVHPAVAAPPALATGAVDLTAYDALLDGGADPEADDAAA